MSTSFCGPRTKAKKKLLVINVHDYMVYIFAIRLQSVMGFYDAMVGREASATKRNDPLDATQTYGS